MAVATVAIVVVRGTTLTTVVVVSGSRGSWGMRGSRGITTSLDNKVIEGQASSIAFSSLATITPQPGVESAPVGDSKGHTVFEVVGHVAVVPAVAGHLDLVSVLGPGGDEGTEIVSTLDEVDLGVEFLKSVDSEVVAGAVC